MKGPETLPTRVTLSVFPYFLLPSTECPTCSREEMPGTEPDTLALPSWSASDHMCHTKLSTSVQTYFVQHVRDLHKHFKNIHRHRPSLSRKGKPRPGSHRMLFHVSCLVQFSASLNRVRVPSPFSCNKGRPVHTIERPIHVRSDARP